MAIQWIFRSGFLACVLVAARAALAQPGDGLMGPGVPSRDLGRIEEILSLNDSQRELVRMLHDGYQSEFRARTEAFRTALREVRERARAERDPSLFREMRDDMQAFAQESEQLDATFMSDVKALLTPEQAERWPIVERARRRWRHLERGMVRGEGVDLIQIVDDMSLTEPTAQKLAPLLDQYARELDDRLRARIEAYEEAWASFSELRQEGDMGAIEELMNEGREAGIEVRDVNERFAQRIADALPSDMQGDFQERVRQETFPNVYRRSHTRAALDAVAGFSDLDASQHAKIDAIIASFERDVADVNMRLVAAIEESDEQEVTMRDMFRRRRGRFEGEAGEIQEEKRALEREVLAELHAALTPEQIERLPEAPRQRAWGPRRSDDG